MKPRLRMLVRRWTCASRADTPKKFVVLVGYGATPVDAYNDWRARCP